MKLRITHETRYRYRQRITLLPHRLMMTPRSSHELTLLASTLTCSPDAALTWSQDVFGNMIATATFAEPTAELTILGEALVEQSAPAWPVLLIDPEAHAYPFAYAEDDLADLGALRWADEDPAGQVRAWAWGFVLGPVTDTLSLLKDINAGILGTVAYRTRDEEGTQSPRQTLEMASGSCRDIAALFIAAVRHLGFGARAVSGYLFDPDIAADDGGATHAWAEVFLPGAGWIAFDPTHRRMGSAHLVAVAVSRSNRQIMPITGGYVGAEDDFLDMNVTVRVQPD
jgi:transglutaminase-like putative cysteine protease